MNQMKNLNNADIKDREIEKLRNELANAQKTIEQQKIKINNLENELNKYQNNNSLQNIIKQKELEIENLKLQLKNNNIKEEKKLFGFDDIQIVNFISSDSKVHFIIKCVKNDTFAEIEEKLYREYPEYRETNNMFLANGKQILRFKTIEQNNIGNGLPVTLVAPPK
jgi:predicted RNase H-like nuclease (RuvC/YqgF family)